MASVATSNYGTVITLHYNGLSQTLNSAHLLID